MKSSEIELYNSMYQLVSPSMKILPRLELVPIEETEASGINEKLGAFSEKTLITEVGLATLLGKCKASIKHAIERGELPRPVKLMGKNTWTVGAIIRHLESRLDKEKNKFQRHSI